MLPCFVWNTFLSKAYPLTKLRYYYRSTQPFAIYLFVLRTFTHTRHNVLLRSIANKLTTFVHRIGHNHMMNKENKAQLSDALAYFHQAPYKLNCAQSIMKAAQGVTGISDEAIALQYGDKGGGKAPGGLCGALYSAKQILGPDSPEAAALEAEFEATLGGKCCKQLKGELKVPCERTVSLAQTLLEKHLKAR